MSATTILAIDAAWTEKQPTGVCVLVGEGKKWRCAGLAPSYESFICLAKGCPVNWRAKLSGSKPDVPALVAAAAKLADTKTVDLVTIDMPVATCRIKERRKADDEISREFGRNKCSTHSPNEVRPGPLGHHISNEFRRLGFTLGTKDVSVGCFPHLIEVYPHPALLRLMNLNERLPYKVSKSLRYWPGTSPEERIALLLEQFELILTALSGSDSVTGGSCGLWSAAACCRFRRGRDVICESSPKRQQAAALQKMQLSDPIKGIPLSLPKPCKSPTLTHLKRYEDALDALVSGWVGIQYLEGNAEPFGDRTAAILVPCAAKNKSNVSGG